ncbi:hypothetical protein NU219Hw_g4276t1 [Hortaea werneckii]
MKVVTTAKEGSGWRWAGCPAQVGASAYRKAAPSYLVDDIEATHQQLQAKTLGFQQHALGALTRLSGAYESTWQDDFDPSKPVGNKYFLFESQAAQWTEMFLEGLETGKPMMLSPPSPVVDSLRAAEPYKVEERSWLVLFYGVILTAVRAKDPSDDFTATRLKHNLWLAFNDVRILLEPSDVNIQALMMLACHVEDFTSPSLCWMLVNNACRLLQNAGITDRRLDPQVKDRRRKTFWALNMLDKTLALTFGRPPTFHRALAREIEPPPLVDLMEYKPHRPPEGMPSSFGAHHFHHLFLLSRIMGDIWHCLYEEDYNLHTIKQQRKELDGWYFEATKVLEAALLVEKPFLSQASMGKRNALARQLEVTASTLLSHARSVIYPTASDQDGTAAPPSASTATPLLNEDQQLVEASDPGIGHVPHNEGIDVSTVPFSEDFLTWPDDLFGDASFDWFAWEKDFLA